MPAQQSLEKYEAIGTTAVRTGEVTVRSCQIPASQAGVDGAVTPAEGIGSQLREIVAGSEPFPGRCQVSRRVQPRRGAAEAAPGGEAHAGGDARLSPTRCGTPSHGRSRACSGPHGRLELVTAEGTWRLLMSRPRFSRPSLDGGSEGVETAGRGRHPHICGGAAADAV